MIKALDDYSDISDRFREVRKKSGLTQREFGKIIGLSSPSVGALENGAYTPSFAVLRRMRINFKLDYTWFIDGRRDGKGLEAELGRMSEEIERLSRIIDKLVS